jgi:glycine/D-amino acid oxidase-like deaminating enzyme
MSGSYDVAIVGAGIVGLSAARCLARAGRRVAVLERGQPGGEASGRNGGHISPGIDSSWAPLALRALDLWPDLAAELGDVGLRQAGGLYAVMEHDPTSPEAIVAYRRGRGFTAEVIDASECARLLPGLTTRIKGGVLSPRHGQVEPRLLMAAISRAAVTEGVTMRGGEAVLRVVVERDAVVGVDTASGRVEAPVVIDAAGPWATAVAATAGVRLPVTPRRIQILASERIDPRTDLTWGGNGTYGRQTATGELHFGAEGPPWDPPADTFDRHPTGPTIQRIARRFVELFPALADVTVTRAWAGIIAPSEDGQPIIELMQHPRGLAIAAGFGGNGFGTGPAAGECVAELVLGASQHVDARPYALDRAVTA